MAAWRSSLVLSAIAFLSNVNFSGASLSSGTYFVQHGSANTCSAGERNLGVVNVTCSAADASPAAGPVLRTVGKSWQRWALNVVGKGSLEGSVLATFKTAYPVNSKKKPRCIGNMVVASDKACAAKPVAAQVDILPGRPEVWELTPIKGRDNTYTIAVASRDATCLRFLGGPSSCSDRYAQLYAGPAAMADAPRELHWVITLVDPVSPSPSPADSPSPTDSPSPSPVVSPSPSPVVSPSLSPTPTNTVPSSPTNVVAVASTGANSQTATITWTAPASNGGLAITSYSVLCTSAGGAPAGPITYPGSATTTGVNGYGDLTPDVPYTCTVVANNFAGSSLPSAPSNAFIIIDDDSPPPEDDFGTASESPPSSPVVIIIDMDSPPPPPSPPPATALPAWFFDVFVYNAETKTLTINSDINVVKSLNVATNVSITTTTGRLNLPTGGITYYSAPTAPYAPIQTSISTSSWSASWSDSLTAGVPTETYKIRCVQEGGACKSPVVAESMAVKRGVQAATVSGLTAGAQLTCFVVAFNDVGDVCSNSSPTVSIPTTVSIPQVWTSRASAADISWFSVTWGGPSGGEKFVAVANSGTGNRVMTSPDGVTWTSRASAADNQWLSVTWGGPSGSQKFVAVAGSGTGNRVMTSPDGVTWTSRASAADNVWSAVTWGGPSGSQKFVAVAYTGSGNRVMTSPDGVTWTSRTSAADISWWSVTWGGPSGGEKFVAVAGTGTGNRVMTSPDGVTWTPRASAADNNWVSVTWGGPSGNQKFVAVASASWGNVMTSPDGVTWTARASAADNQWSAVTWGGPSGSQKFVAVATYGIKRVMTSPDGLTWTSEASVADNFWCTVTWGGPAGNQKFVALSRYGSNRVMTSPT